MLDMACLGFFSYEIVTPHKDDLDLASVKMQARCAEPFDVGRNHDLAPFFPTSPESEDDKTQRFYPR